MTNSKVQHDVHGNSKWQTLNLLLAVFSRLYTEVRADLPQLWTRSFSQFFHRNSEDYRKGESNQKYFFLFTSRAILSPQEPLSMSKWIRRIQKLSEFSSTLTNHQSSATLTFPKRNQLTEWLLFRLLMSFTRWVSSYFNHISSPAGFWWDEASWDVGHE